MPEEPPVSEKPVETYKPRWGCFFIMIAVLVGLFLLAAIFIPMAVFGWDLGRSFNYLLRSLGL
jgi:uncharacterized membrane protein